MKFSTTLVAAFAAVALSAPVEPQQAQEAAQGGDQIAVYEDYGGDSKSTKICSIEKSQKKCIEIDTTSGHEEYKCEGADGHYKDKCEEEAEKKLIEEYKRKKAFKEFEKKKEFEEFERKKEAEKYLREHPEYKDGKHGHHHGPWGGPKYEEAKKLLEEKEFEEYLAKKKYEEEETKKKLEALKDKWEAEEAIDKLCSIKDKDGKCQKKKGDW